jgi:hypothetical protein
MEKISTHTLLPRCIRSLLFYFIIIFNGKFIYHNKNKVNEFLYLKTKGVTRLQDIGNDDFVKSLKAIICSLPYHSSFSSHDAILKKNFDPQALVNIESVLNFAVDPYTIKLCESYFNSRVQIAFITAWQSFSNDVKDSAEMSFHMDHHGYKFLKKFCYLDDVFNGDGEHYYIRGSTDLCFSQKKWDFIERNDKQLFADLKRKRKLKGGFILSNDRVESFFKDDIECLTGKAGTVFIEDTFGLHRGSPLQINKSRLILQVLYVPWVLRKDLSKNVFVDINRSLYPELAFNVMKDSYRLIT